MDSTSEGDAVSGGLAECVEYWRTKFAGTEPTVFPPVVSESLADVQCSTRAFELDLEQKFAAFGPETFFTAAWVLLLGRYSENQQDVVFGTAAAPLDRGSSDILPFRATWSSGMLVSEFLAYIKTELHRVQEFNGIDLAEIADLSEDARRACGLRSIATVRLGDPDQFSDGQEITPRADVPWSLHLSAYVQPHRYELRALHTTTLGSRQVDLILAQLEHVYRQLLDMNGAKLSDIDPCSDADRTQIYMWNSAPPPVYHQTVPQLFEAQCKAQPNAPAVCCWDSNLTYAELDDLSSRLACHLVSLGVKVEDIVPTCFDKSAWAVVSMLAIMRAGAACVNLSPSHPIDRKRQIAKMCGSSVTVTTEKYSSDFDDSMAYVVKVHPGFLRALPLPETAGLSLPMVDPHHKAYVLFTSGSTGGESPLRAWLCLDRKY